MKNRRLAPNHTSLESLTALAFCLLLPACVMPGQRPALGSDSLALDSCEDGLVDDGEDGNNQVLVRDGRNGYWYTYVDENGSTVEPEAGSRGGTFEMAPGGANGSKFSANVHGKTAGGSGVRNGGVGFNFVDPKSPYDASRYNGIAFYARKGSGSTGKVRLKVPDAATTPEAGTCRECFNDFGADLNLTEQWQRFVFPFKKLKQEPDWGSPRPRSINKAKLYGIQFQVGTPGTTFDIYIDHVELVGCE